VPAKITRIPLLEDLGRLFFLDARKNGHFSHARKTLHHLYAHPFISLMRHTKDLSNAPHRPRAVHAFDCKKRKMMTLVLTPKVTA
jgi:hypothetical protein